VDRLESMFLFVSVVEGGSLSAASRKLNIPLATVSRKISDLETHLKIKLLTRTTRRLELTDSGRIYFASCRRILEELAEVERVATGEYTSPKGHLTITAPDVFGKLHLLPIVTDFLKAYPEIDIRLILSDRVVDLLEERVDIALRIGRLTDSTMISRGVGFIREVVCGSPTYFKSRGIPKQPEDLITHDCVTFDRLGEATEWNFRKGKNKKSITVHSRLTASSSEAAMEAAISGIGVTRVLSYQVMKHLESRKLSVALEEYESEALPVSLVYAGARSLPLKMRAFLDFTSPRLKKNLPQSR
jgi:DNA-binding transcriptional LysR family regulator